MIGAAGLLPGNGIDDGVVEVGAVVPTKIEVAAVLFGDVFDGDEGFEGGQDFCGGENENLGDGYGVEPALDPAPDSGEEGGGANDLGIGGIVD